MNGSAALDIRPHRRYVVDKAAAGFPGYRPDVDKAAAGFPGYRPE